MYMTIRWVAVLALMSLVGCSPSPSVQPDLDPHLATEDAQTLYGHVQADTVRRPYPAGNVAPIWVRREAPTEEARALLERLCAAGREGLRPSTYAVDSIEATLRRAYVDPPEDDALRAEHLATLDRLLTTAFLTYADHLANGRITPNRIDNNWHLDRDTLNGIALLRQAFDEGVHTTLDSLADRSTSYAALREALPRYRTIAENGGWPHIPEGPALTSGADGERVALLRDRLETTNDLSSDAPGDAVYNEAVENAVLRFQRRHGLEPDGVVGRETLNALNVPAETRVEQLILNMERHRWLPNEMGNTFIFVNLTDFQLSVYEDGHVAFEMPVIIGEQGWQTPAFADTMSHVVFGPYWNVPASIATEEILPQIRADSSFLERNNYEIVNAEGAVVDTSRLSEEALENHAVRIRQQPGPGNALGQVKFMFPNNFNIYLHDTPADHLFARDQRTLSHGCIRVQSPVTLADYVLDDEEWPRDSIRVAMREAENRHVSIDRTIPVFIAYLTAWATADDMVHFRDDLYGYDPELRRTLAPLAPEDNACASLRTYFASSSDARAGAS